MLSYNTIEVKTDHFNESDKCFHKGIYRMTSEYIKEISNPTLRFQGREIQNMTY